MHYDKLKEEIFNPLSYQKSPKTHLKDDLNLISKMSCKKYI